MFVVSAPENEQQNTFCLIGTPWKTLVWHNSTSSFVSARRMTNKHKNAVDPRRKQWCFCKGKATRPKSCLPGQWTTFQLSWSWSPHNSTGGKRLTYLFEPLYRCCGCFLPGACGHPQKTPSHEFPPCGTSKYFDRSSRDWGTHYQMKGGLTVVLLSDVQCTGPSCRLA